MHTIFELIYKGALLGLITAFSFGPIFFSIIETSIRKGVYFSVFIALGVLLSDAAIITLSFLSIARFIQDPQIKNIIGAAGGILLVGFGIYHFIKPIPHPKTIEVHEGRKDYLLYLFKGFVINTINPFSFIYWLSAVSIVIVDPDYTEPERILFFIAAILCNFFFDISKAVLASKLKHLMTHRTMTIVSKCVGVGIAFFGVQLLLKTVI
ncbi:MAG: LysE family translocator [Chitinophagales bacterium]|nr:LysE family translocator [Chitinophagales bacterium]